MGHPAPPRNTMCSENYNFAALLSKKWQTFPSIVALFAFNFICHSRMELFGSVQQLHGSTVSNFNNSCFISSYVSKLKVLVSISSETFFQTLGAVILQVGVISILFFLVWYLEGNCCFIRFKWKKYFLSLARGVSPKITWPKVL